MAKIKLSDRTEEFHRQKKTLFWFSAVGLIIAMGAVKIDGMPSSLQVYLQPNLLSGMIFFAILYYLFTFVLEWIAQYDINSEIKGLVRRGDLAEYHESLSGIYKSSVEEISKFLENFHSSWQEDLSLIARESDEILQKRTGEFFGGLDEEIGKAESLAGALLSSLPPANLNNLVIDGRSDYDKAVNDYYSQIRKDISRQRKEMLSQFKNVRREYGKAVSITSSIKFEKEIFDAVMNFKAPNFNKNSDNLKESIKYLSDIGSKLKKFGDFEESILKVDKWRLLVIDGAVPSIFALMVLFLTGKNVCEFLSKLWSALGN